jgi:hypothetical protein
MTIGSNFSTEPCFRSVWQWAFGSVKLLEAGDGSCDLSILPNERERPHYDVSYSYSVERH